MSSLAKAVSFDATTIWVDFLDGRKLGIPLAYFPRLLRALGRGTQWVRAEFEQKPLAKAIGKALSEQDSDVQRVMTPGGKFQVRWDEGGSVTALGQLAFFAEFMEVSGLFEHWVDG